MSKTFSFLYGFINYIIFFAVFLYLIAFVGDFGVSKTVSSGVATGSTSSAILINLFLISLFAIQHTIMARGTFKDWITQYIPTHLERSTYLLATDIILILIFVFWQPINGVLWHFESSFFVTLFYTLFALGWLLVLISTFLTNHFDLFGLRQMYLHLRDIPYTHVKFTEILFYQWIRHPMMLGLLIAFWATPVMTYSHLLFSLAMSAYIFIGIYFEERELVKNLGEEYQQYLKRTSKIFPFCRKNKA